MAYSSGLLDKSLTYFTPTSTIDDFGNGSITWKQTNTIHCSLTWTKGATAMKAGELQAYDVVMVRTRYFENLTRECRLKIDDKFYHIDSYHYDYKANTIQITATEIEAFDYTV